jgi:hypothetical protein
VGQDSQTTMGVVAAAPEINAPSACWATEEPQLPGDCPSPRRGLLTGHSLNGRCQDGDHSMVRPVGQIGEWMKLWGGIATMSCRIDWAIARSCRNPDPAFPPDSRMHANHGYCRFSWWLCVGLGPWFIRRPGLSVSQCSESSESQACGMEEAGVSR